MMKPIYRTSLFLAISAFSGASAFAQYSPSVGDLNTIFEPPMNIQGIICGAYTDANQISICKDGSVAARWMAEKYAKNAGAYLGCVDGISQGLNEGYSAGLNPTTEMTNNAKAYVAGATFSSAIARAQDDANRNAQTVTADQIISRYRAVIGKYDSRGQQVLPMKSYELPANSFKGYDDGYNVDVLSKDPSFNAVYQAGWVNSSDIWTDQVAASRLYAIQGDYAARACNQNGTVFGRRNMPVMTFWDYFRNRAKVNFENYGWNNADWAFDVLMKDENTLDTYVTYTSIEKMTKQVTTQEPIMATRNKLDANGLAIPKMNADGTPVKDSQGVIQYVTEQYQTGVQTITKTVPLSDGEKQTLRNAYHVGFKESYKRYYARQYASQNYHSVGLDKYSTGKEIGVLLGREVAQKTAMQNAYNSQYKVVSAASYAEKAKGNYKKSFDYLINIFENNPVLELNTAQVLGQTEDGIFRAGEELKIQFAATNLGEVTRPATFSILGSRDVTPTQAGFSFSVPRLGQSTFTSGTLGRVLDGIRARNTINVTFGLQNPGDLKEVAKSLNIQKNQEILINDYLEVNRATSTLDYLNGTLTASADLINPAASSAPVSVSKVELNLGSYGLAQSNTLMIPGGGTQNLALTVNQIDPMAIIEAGGVNGIVSTYVGDKLAHSVNIQSALPEEKTAAKLRYFDALATRKSLNSGVNTTQDRMAQLMTVFSDITKNYIGRDEGNIRWDDNSAVKGTFVFLIQKMYLESANAKRIDAQAQGAYNQLGQLLSQHERNINAGGFMKSAKKNKRAYINQLRVFAKDL